MTNNDIENHHRILFQQAKTGNTCAWESLRALYSERLTQDIRYSVHKALKDAEFLVASEEEVVSDIVSDTWDSAYKYCQNFEYTDREQTSHWLRVIGMYHISNWKRHQRRREEELRNFQRFGGYFSYFCSYDPKYEKNLILRESVDEVLKIIDQLINPLHKKIFLLYYLEDISVPELASTYHLRQKTIYQIFYRIKKSVRDYLVK